jgi:hypothetical protein
MVGGSCTQDDLQGGVGWDGTGRTGTHGQSALVKTQAVWL